jgi:hypothetical protein
MTIAFTGLPTAEVAAIRASGRDAYDNPIEHQVSDGVGVPCRHCLQQVPKGQGYLILAHRPFESRNPYAETGPIFLCADDCAPAVPGPDLPPMLASAQYIVRGYSGRTDRLRHRSGCADRSYRRSRRGASVAVGYRLRRRAQCVQQLLPVPDRGRLRHPSPRHAPVKTAQVVAVEIQNLARRDPAVLAGSPGRGSGSSPRGRSAVRQLPSGTPHRPRAPSRAPRRAHRRAARTGAPGPTTSAVPVISSISAPLASRQVFRTRISPPSPAA